MTTEAPEMPTVPPVGSADVATLEAIERRVLWLATAMVDHANKERADPSGLKVGGHQASSASLVSVMTALWFDQLRAADRVSVKPHASPVLHAINYLLGRLDRKYLMTLRAFGGVQSYPSRLKDPDPVDYSTGSVGIGATAPLWGAVAHRYLAGHFGVPEGGRQYSLVGDAELDEGACWEAILDPMVAGLGEVVWIVDVNRQSLDRVVPNVAALRLMRMFEGAGWQVLTAKYGTVLAELFARPGGDALRRRIDDMSNPEYQRILRTPPGPGLRARVLGTASPSSPLGQLLADVDDAHLQRAVRNLGGHDQQSLRAAFAAIDDSVPTVVFAYTVKGYGLPTEGHPRNHSSLLNAAQMAGLAERLGVDPGNPWAGFGVGTPEAALCDLAARRLQRPPVPAGAPVAIPVDLGRSPSATGSTQSAFGRVLIDLTREAPEVAARLVTLSPDVSTSTNLAGWVTKVGVWSGREQPDWFADDPDAVMRWREGPRGQHVELGIAEINLVCALGEFGSTWSRWGQPLFPIGVLYDPFVERALEPWSFGIYSGGQSILVGTPSGVSLASEGGAHQSIKTPSIGLEQPGCVSYEPAFVVEVEWMLLDAISRLGRAGGSSTYLRLSTRPLDQALAQLPPDQARRDERRRMALAGAYPLQRPSGPQVTICASGPMVADAVHAAGELAGHGVAADVVCVTSPDLLYRAVRARRGFGSVPEAVLDAVFPAERARPMVTVLDGHPHTLAFLATIHNVPSTNLGVTDFGQSGDLASVYRAHEIDAQAIIAAVWDLID